MVFSCLCVMVRWRGVFLFCKIRNNFILIICIIKWLNLIKVCMWNFFLILRFDFKNNLK